MYYKVTNEELSLKANDFWGRILWQILMTDLAAAIVQCLGQDHA